VLFEHDYSYCMQLTTSCKGGVEGDIKFVKGNFLPFFNERQRERKITLPKIQDLTEALEHWGREVADTHIIYGVERSPLEIFNGSSPLFNHYFFITI
jgi:hypothetical protein